MRRGIGITGERRIETEKTEIKILYKNISRKEEGWLLPRVALDACCELKDSYALLVGWSDLTTRTKLSSLGRGGGEVKKKKRTEPYF